MARAARLTDAKIKNLKPGLHADLEVPGLFVRVREAGAKSYTIVARDPYGKQIWRMVPRTNAEGLDTLDDVRPRAREGIKRLKAGLEPFPPPPPKPDTFQATAEAWVEHHVKAKGLRSRSEIERCLERYVYPVWGKRNFTSIERLDVAKLLDSIVEQHGARQANAVLAIIRGLMNWYATRSNDYVSPIVKGMARPVPKGAKAAHGPASSGGKRERVLSDDELCLLLPIFGERGTYGAILKLALLTAQRADKIATMQWTDVSIDGVWRIATEEREKGNAGTLALPETTLDIIRGQPRIEGNPYVFPGRDRKRPEGKKAVDPADLARPFAGWSPCKEALDEKILEARRGAAVERGENPKKVKPLDHWTTHDLRRTAKSLMMRAGVPRFHAERVLGHVIPGVEGVYDRHDYAAERKQALAALAVMVERILKPPVDNVVDLNTARA